MDGNDGLWVSCKTTLLFKEKVRKKTLQDLIDDIMLNQKNKSLK